MTYWIFFLQDFWKMRCNEESNEALLIKPAFSLGAKKALNAAAQPAGNSDAVPQIFLEFLHNVAQQRSSLKECSCGVMYSVCVAGEEPINDFPLCVSK